MRKLSNAEVSAVHGGNYECSFVRGNMIVFYFLIADANQLNGWLTAQGDNPILECHEV